MAGELPQPRGRRLSGIGPEPGAVLGRWSLRRLVGEGAMAEVWSAGEVGRDGEVAIKVLRPGGDRVRFEREVETLSGLSCPGVLPVLDRGDARGRAWFAMPLVDGIDMAGLAEKLRARPVAERHARARAVADELAETLGHLHRAGLVHRDVKPSNVLVGRRAILVDFGVAGPPGQAEGFVGTPAWAAPEQLAGEHVDERADQYGLGLVLYHVLTGRRPHGDSRLRAADARPRPPSELDPTVPADLEAVVMRLLAPRASRRFPGMDEVRASLSAVSLADASILAGRQGAADQVAAALDRVAAGEGMVLRLVGGVGAGQDWLVGMARAGAARRALSCVVADDALGLARATQRVDDGDAVLVLTALAATGAEIVELPPLGVGDIRRSVFAVAPHTPSLAAVAERVHALTGGHARLVESVLRTGTDGGVLVVDPPPPLDVSPWIEALDLDALGVAQALAALPGAVSAAVLEAVAHCDVTVALPELERLGLAVRVGEQWRLSASCFRDPLLATAPDAEALRQSAAALSRQPWADDPVLGAARLAIEAGRHADAIAAILEGIDTDGAPEGVLEERRLLLASLHWFLGDAAGAERVWRLVLDTAGDPRRRARAGVGLGVVALQAGRLDAALDALSAALVDAELAGDVRTAALAGLDLAEARAIRGELADALRCARRALDHGRALGDRALEAKCGRALGQVLLDVGQPAEAERVLADAAALARAVGVEEARVSATVLRARASLDLRPGDPVAAAVALDRLLPIAPAAHDPEGFDALLLAVRARALAFAGDRERARHTLSLAREQAENCPLEMRTRALAECCRAALAAGDEAAARQVASVLRASAVEHRLGLLLWEADAMLAVLDGAPRPDPSSLGMGLPEAARRALHGRAP